MSSSDSDSDSSQTQIQESQDNRISGAAGSVNLVMSRSDVGGNVTLSTTDHGSVGKAFDFAAMLAKGAANESAASGAAVTKLAMSAMDSVQSAYADSNQSLASAYEGTSNNLADAWSTAKAGEQKIMVVAGLGVLALVAIKVFGSKA